MASLTFDQLVARRRAARVNIRESPWFNGKLLFGLTIFLAIFLFGVVGPVFWDSKLALTASSPLNLPPIWVQEPPRGFLAPEAAHPLGTESNGRDMLALLMAAAPGSLRVGL